MSILQIIFLLFFFFCTKNFLIAEEFSPLEAEQLGKAIRDKWSTEIPVDETRLRQAGVRRLDSQHLTLYTDLPSNKEIDGLPKLFDQLIPLLCDYFELDYQHYETFHVEGYLIQDFEKFKTSGAVMQVPNLRNGYALRCRIWIQNPNNDYYRRHLLLHEGTHTFMGYAFGVWGPPWYREGTAELFGTHCFENGKLKSAYFPKSSKELPRWGRIDLVRNNFRKQESRTISKIFELDSEDYDENEAYGWSWAFAIFCENHPRYKKSFRQAAWMLHGSPAAVNQRFIELAVKNARKEFPSRNDDELLYRFEDDWQDFVVNLSYGYDFERTKIDYTAEPVPLPVPGANYSVRADRGWQSAGIQLERGKTYSLTTMGRFQLANQPKIWWSEANGITIRYYNGVPIGTLFATMIPELNERFVTKNGTAGVGFASPRKIGSGDKWTADVTGELFFRINDFPSELSDNQGEITVLVKSE